MSRLYSTLKCKGCGRRFFMPRPKEWRKELNVKLMFCGKCKKDSSFEEIDYTEWGKK